MSNVNWTLLFKGTIGLIAFGIICGSYLYYGSLNNPVEQVAQEVLEKEVGLEITLSPK